MSFVLNMPPSVVAKKTKEEDVEGGGGGEEEGEPSKKREDWKKLKELEEARKAGTAPAMKDEEGKDINPHIPQYIMQAPWYFGATAPTLKHQRVQEEKMKSFSSMDAWYKRGVKAGSIATKYRKGACENCGAMTHKKIDCLERPRKIGAKYTGDKIAPDEYIQPQLDFDYDGKRDRWNGYDPKEHQDVIEEFSKLEEAKKALKSQKIDDTLQGGTEEEAETPKESKKSQGDGDDEDKYADDVDMPGQKFESKHRITVRNLRIREDTAKYLHNLDVNSAYYDPKTRSMRQNPLANTNQESTDMPFGGDNFVRSSGMAHEFAKQQLFAWDAYEKGADVHLQADPTKLELLAKEYEEKTEEFEESHKNNILRKYGGQEHLEAPPKELLLAQTENYVEYSRHGRVIKGQESEIARSRYEEDVYINNHTSVWGSYWKEGRWGYKCCHSLIKGSYCTGEAGKDANDDQTVALLEPPKIQVQETEVKSLLEEHREKLKEKKKEKKKKKKKKKHKKKKSSSSSSGSEEEDEEAIMERKVQLALKQEEERLKEVDRVMKMDERKRPYNSMYESKEPTEEEMEVFYRKRRNVDDPMAAFLGQ